jgi:intracellular multiplication protein IcmG
MSDNKNFEEEYQYVDESGIDDNQHVQEEVVEKAQSKPQSNKEFISKINSIIQQPNIRRNGLIAVGSLLLIIFIIKSLGNDDIAKKSANTDKAIVPEKVAAVQNPMLQAPVIQKTIDIVPQNDQTDRLMNIKRNVESNISSMREQINQLSNQVNNLNTTNQALINQLSDLTAKLQASQQVIEELLAAKKAQPIIRKTKPMASKTMPKLDKVSYFVQAVIPGRAWLVNSQGATLTVRVGSKVPGFGVVHRIDALQGRVTMSSGHVIAFSQAD